MKNLLNCHSIGLHSFPISVVDGLYKRIFYADTYHNLWKQEPLEIAIHPHHVDIKIRVLEGVLYNLIYDKTDDRYDFNRYQSFKWNSVILNGQGGFEKLDDEYLKLTSATRITKGNEVFMKACELHTVFVDRGKRAVWLIEETLPTCEYFPINYSNQDLINWKPNNLYVETNDAVKDFYIKDYINQV